MWASMECRPSSPEGKAGWARFDQRDGQGRAGGARQRCGRRMGNQKTPSSNPAARWPFQKARWSLLPSFETDQKPDRKHDRDRGIISSGWPPDFSGLPLPVDPPAAAVPCRRPPSGGAVTKFPRPSSSYQLTWILAAAQALLHPNCPRQDRPRIQAGVLHGSQIDGDPPTEQGDQKKSPAESGQCFQQFLQYNGLVMLFIRGTVNQRDPASLRALRHLEKGRSLIRGAQLGEIPGPKGRPLPWIMREPFPQLSTRSPFFCPLIDMGPGFADPARPHAIHKDAQAVIWAGIRIDTLDPYHDRLRSVTRLVNLGPRRLRRPSDSGQRSFLITRTA